MPTRVAKKRRNDQVMYRNTKGKMRSGQVIKDQTAPTATPATTTAATGGTLTAATYSYRVTLVYGPAGLESAPSPAKTQTTSGTTSTVTVDWSGLIPAVGLQPTAAKVYGRTAGSELLMATVNMPTTTFVDTAGVTPAGALAADTGQVLIHLGPGPTLPNVLASKMTAYKGATASYVKR